MSGRIRTVKPEWLDDELLVLASDAARVLSIGLMVLADDYGNGRANPIQLAGKVFPGKVIEHTANALEELRRMNFVVLYEVDGQRYFSIRNWSKHQRVDKPGNPRVPGPPAQTPQNSQASEAAATRSPSLAKVPGSPANPLASRGSDPGPDPDPDPGRGPDPDPGQARDTKALAEAALRDPQMASLQLPLVQDWPEVREVCEAFAATWGRQDKPRHQGDPRARAILGRLAEGIPVAQLVAAVRGSKFASYIAENQANQALVTILRDGSQVDKFSALTGPSARAPVKRTRGGPPQADHGMTGWEGEEAV